MLVDHRSQIISKQDYHIRRFGAARDDECESARVKQHPKSVHYVIVGIPDALATYIVGLRIL